MSCESHDRISSMASCTKSSTSAWCPPKLFEHSHCLNPRPSLYLRFKKIGRLLHSMVPLPLQLLQYVGV